MKNNITILTQLLHHIDQNGFRKAVKVYKGNKCVRKLNSYAHFAVLLFAQLTGQHSIRDIETSMNSKKERLYHLGIPVIKRSTLSDANRKRSHEIYKTVFSQLIQKITRIAPGHKFRFKNPVKILDASTIDLCLSVFPWAQFRQKKGAIKLHVEYDLDTQIPTFVSLTDGKVSDITEARKMTFEKGSILVFDRGYVDYCWYNQLNTQGIFFVTRLKRNMKYRVIERRKINTWTGITSDQIIRVTGTKSDLIPCELRRIRYVNPEDNQEYIFLTNIMHLSARTIAELYKARWEIELFFKWIKQHLKIKSFLGTNKNAVMSQIWAALCLYLILTYIKYQCRLNWKMHKMMVVLRFNALRRINLYDLLYESKQIKQETKFTQFELAFL
jgi:hypothetical protein